MSPTKKAVRKKSANPAEAAVRYFRSPAEFRAWLGKHHEKAPELWVGFHKRATGEPSLTWPESVDEALCYGWIDGVRKRIDDDRYKIRFTPRRKGSVWSAVNIRRVGELEAEKRMKPAGRAAFGLRKEKRSKIYAYEQPSAEIPEPYASELGRNDCARIAQSMGCAGVRVESVKDLLGELDRAKGAKEPLVLDVVTTEDAPFWQVQSPLAKEGPGGE